MFGFAAAGAAAFCALFWGTRVEEPAMSLLISNIRLPLDAPENDAVRAALRAAGLPVSLEGDAYIARQAPDLRHGQASFVYTVGIDLPAAREKEAMCRVGSAQIRRRDTAPFDPQPGSEPMEGRPVIVGFGPAGMFAGLLLAYRGYRPLIVERGAPVEARAQAVARFWREGALDADTNVQFGEGGAGTFSDGKLTTRIGDPLCAEVLRQFAAHGAPQEILRAAKPHIGTDRLRGVVRAIREDIVAHGGEVRFRTRLTGLRVQSGRVRAACLGGGEEAAAGTLILAAGHSARDTFEMLLQSGVRLEPKPFSVGVRIEHLQSAVEQALYGRYAGHPRLPRGEYQLSLRKGERAVYTFCMCPGGTVVAAASEPGGVVTNGMSDYNRDRRNANAALVVSVDAFPAPLDGVAFQRELERAAFAAGGGDYRAPCQTVGAFLAGKPGAPGDEVTPSYPAGVTPARLDTLFAPGITAMLRDGLRAFGRRQHGFDAPQAVLTGVETRTSSPVRIPRTAACEAVSMQGLYPAGEGAGYAGGIMSAAVDGLRVAAAVVTRYAPPKA